MMGRMPAKDFKPYRDELVISTKAGFDYWDGPYGKGGSRKYLTASLDRSLDNWVSITLMFFIAMYLTMKRHLKKR